MSVISTPFPWSPLKLYSNSTPWSGVGVEFSKIEWSWSGNSVEIKKISGVGVELHGVGVGMELEILNFSETNSNS